MAKGIKGIPDVPSQKPPKKCVKTVALRSGRPEYICPASGGRGAVERLGRLPVRPEDVPRKMLERQIASPEETLHPKQRMMQEAKPKPPKTMHFIDIEEAKEETPDTLHFQDPKEATQKSLILFGDDSVVADSIYIGGDIYSSDLVKAGAMDWYANKMDEVRKKVSELVSMGLIAGGAIGKDMTDNPWATTADVALAVAPVPVAGVGAARGTARAVRWVSLAIKALDKAKKTKNTINVSNKYRKARNIEKKSDILRVVRGTEGGAARTTTAGRTTAARRITSSVTLKDGGSRTIIM